MKLAETIECEDQAVDMDSVTIIAEAAIFDDVVFDAEKEYELDGERSFDEIQADLVDQINGILPFGYLAEDTFVAEGHVELEIYDENMALVGDGRIYVWGVP